MGVAYAALAMWRHDRFTLVSWDNAIFEQALRGYSTFDAPIVDVKGPGFNILGDHFSPIYALLAPFYRIWPSADLLFVAQAVLLALSIYVVAALAMRRLGTGWGAAIGSLYAVSFGLQSAAKVEFHEVAFAAPLLALAGAAWVERRFAHVVGWSLPLLLVKEDLGLTVAVIGAVLWWAGDRRRGAVLGAAGVLGTSLAVLVIIPAMNPDDVYGFSSSLGGGEGLLPTLFAEAGRKGWTVAITLGITGLAAVASPWVLVAIPTFAWRFVGDNAFYWGTEYHYSLVLMPIVFVAMIDAIGRRSTLRWAVVPAVLVSALTLVNSPLTQVFDGDLHRPGPREAAARQVLALVPEGASVETDIALMTHLTADRQVYWVGSIGAAVPEYVLFDLAAGIGSPADVESYAEGQHGGDYRIIFDTDGYVLAQRD